MKIVVIGGSGLIGSKLVPKLRERGHEAIAASAKSGVNSVTGEGLTAALKGASGWWTSAQESLIAKLGKTQFEVWFAQPGHQEKLDREAVLPE
jgi:NAD dependent epimerase/dehydratase family enzyme